MHEFFFACLQHPIYSNNSAIVTIALTQSRVFFSQIKQIVLKEIKEQQEIKKPNNTKEI